MTAPSEVVSEVACSQVFTKRYDEFILRNDTVTAFGPERDAYGALTAKPARPHRCKSAGRCIRASCGALIAPIKILRRIKPAPAQQR
jgi:hypothetical protein